MTNAIDGKTAGSLDAAEQTLFSKLAQRHREAKEKRVQMHMRPDLQRRIALLAEKDGLSFSDWCTRALEQAVRQAERDRAIDDALSGDL